MQKLTTELKLNVGGFLEFMTLKMLADRTLSAEEISSRLASIGFKVPMGTLYPLLSRFRAKGFVMRDYEESETGTALRTYDLTAKGRSRLRDLRTDWNRLNSAIASL